MKIIEFPQEIQKITTTYFDFKIKHKKAILSGRLEVIYDDITCTFEPFYKICSLENEETGEILIDDDGSIITREEESDIMKFVVSNL